MKNAIVGIQPEYVLGDANRDGVVNITDVTTAVDAQIKGKFDEASDVNSDGVVDGQDIKHIVNKILGEEKL